MGGVASQQWPLAARRSRCSRTARSQSQFRDNRLIRLHRFGPATCPRVVADEVIELSWFSIPPITAGKGGPRGSRGQCWRPVGLIGSGGTGFDRRRPARRQGGRGDTIPIQRHRRRSGTRTGPANTGTEEDRHRPRHPQVHGQGRPGTEVQGQGTGRGSGLQRLPAWLDLGCCGPGITPRSRAVDSGKGRAADSLYLPRKGGGRSRAARSGGGREANSLSPSGRGLGRGGSGLSTRRAGVDRPPRAAIFRLALPLWRNW
jgi:hypothetical protein